MSLKDKARALARRTDPVTSHAAAASISSESIHRLRDIVLTTLRAHGPMTDNALVELVTSLHKGEPFSYSGLRTRRGELVRLGQVRDTGARERLPSGRAAVVWEATS